MYIDLERFIIFKKYVETVAVEFQIDPSVPDGPLPLPGICGLS
jgi:hypothetical protein